MFCSFKFTKKVFVVMCTCFLIGLVAGGFGIHKAVTSSTSRQGVGTGNTTAYHYVSWHFKRYKTTGKIRHFSRIAGKRYEISQQKTDIPLYLCRM